MKKTICSIFFEEKKATRSYALTPSGPGFNHTYVLPKAEKGKYSTLVVNDGYQRLHVGNKTYFPTPVYADGPGGIAEDLVKQWSAATINEGYGGPGIFVCAGDGPTEQELKGATRSQTMWCKAQVNDASDAWIQGRRHEVNSLHRACAAWLGEFQHEWMRETEQVFTKNCPLCTERINAAAIICPKCNRVIDPARFANYEADLLRVQKETEELKAQAIASDPGAKAKIEEKELVGAVATPVAASKPLPPPMNPRGR